MSKETGHTIIAQAIAEGKPFTRHASIENSAGNEIDLSQKRQCGVVVCLNQDTGMTRYVNGRSEDFGVRVHKQDLQRISTNEAKNMDQANVEGPTFINTQKRGTSKKIIDIDKAIRDRGGNPDYRMKKPDSSFGLGQHPSKLVGTKKAG